MGIIIILGLIVLIIFALQTHGGTSYIDIPTPNSGNKQPQSGSVPQAPMFPAKTVSGWQITLQSARIDGSYPIYAQVQDGQTLLVLHVAFTDVGETNRRFNSNDFVITNLATHEEQRCTFPQQIGDGVDGTYLNGYDHEGNVICFISSDTQTSHTYQISFIDRGLDGEFGTPTSDPGSPMWDLTVKDGAVS